MPPKTSRRSKRKRAAPAEELPAPAGVDSSSADKAANKKKKKEKPSKATTAATTKAKSASSTLSSDQTSLLSSLLQKLQALSSSKSQCTDALNALMEGRVACSIVGFDPSMMKTAASDGTTTSNKKKRNEGDNNTATGDATSLLDFPGDSPLQFLSEDPLTDAMMSKRGGGKKDKKKDSAGDGGGGAADDSGGRNDAHLIMAVTQAINVILSSIKVEGATVFNTATPPPAVAAAAASAKSDDDNDNPVDSNEEYTFEAIMLAALSSHLIVALMNNRTLFETITKASRGGGSSSQSMNNNEAAFGVASSLGDSMMDVDEYASSSRSSPSRGGASSSSTSPQKDTKNVIMSHAKAVVGRALTSAVMGSLWSLETLGNANIPSSDSSSSQLKDDGSSTPEETKAKQSTIRNAMWSSLLALETLFQLTPNPKLLTFSSVMSAFGGNSSMEDVLSTSSMGSGTNYNSRLWSGHAHSMMGMETIEMWNGILKRIMVGYQLGFTLDGSVLSSTDGGGNDYLSQVCLEVSDSMFTSDSNSKFIALVINEFDMGDPISTSAPPPGKKARKTASSRSKKAKQVSEADNTILELSALLRERSENHVMFDCHVSVRRWAVLAFGWLCKGQQRLLETCVTLLTRDDSWNEVMVLPPYESKSAPEAAETTSKKKKKKKDSKKRPLSTTEGQIEGVPGNLSLLVFVCCMIDMIYDAGSSSGMTPPSTGWMDEYVKSIMASPESESIASSAAATASTPSATNKKTSAESSKAPSRRSSRSRAAAQKNAAEKPAAKGSPRGGKRSPGGGKNVWVRPDVRKETVKLAKYLAEAHTRVLQDTFSEMLRLSSPNASNEMRRLLVNVDPQDGSNEESTIRFYPFLHRTLETLGRAASTNSYFASSEGKARVVATGSAVALSCFEQNFGRFKVDMTSNVIVLDAKLLSFAVNEIYECLGNATVDKSSQLLEDYSIPDTILAEYKLNEPLESDAVSDAALDESGAKATSSQTFQSTSGRSSVETLAIFIRAHLPSENASHKHGMDALLRSLFQITRLCYDRMEELDQATSSKSKKNKKKKISSGSPTKQKYHNVAFLASDVVKTLGSCLSRCNHPKDTSTNALLCVRSLFRSFISTELVLDFVSLGDDLHGMIRSSLLQCADQPSDIRWIRMFRAHVDLALILGQGRPGHEVRADVSVIRDSECRLSVYRAVYSERSTPLCLPAFHHALISSTLCASTNSESAQGAAPAEEFLCNSFVNDIEKFLVDFAIPASSSCGIGDDNLVSFRDAQIFAMAFGKLPRNDQMKVLTKLTGILTKGLGSSKISSLNQDSSNFLARAVTSCASLADIYLVPALLPVLSDRIGSSHYDFPSIRPISKRNFRGIFDWLTPSAPTLQAVGTNQVLEVKLFEKIQTMTEAAIATGFDTLTLDGCHLLLSSWNISTKVTGWNASGWAGVTAASRVETMDVIQKLVALREDMFGVHSLVDVNEDPLVQETLLMRLVKQKGQNCSLREVLPAGLSSAESMLKQVTLQVEKKSSPTLPEFVYFEFLPIYVSFLVSKYTRPGKNIADALDRFHRDNEHDELSDDSCCSDASVTRSNALERLHDACFALGAAPCYPDWLDMSCKMTDGISQNVSIDSAKQALKSLTKFGAQVFQRYFGAICKLEDGRTLSGRGSEISKPSSIALQLIAPCDDSILKVVVSNVSRANSTDVSGCVQRINGVEGFEGWKANQGERRANGQWEIILLEALTQGSESKAVLDEYSQLGIRGGAREKHDVIKIDIEDVIRWRRILLSVVNALVPTCALLRFAINGKGRKEDPLSLGHSSPSANEESFVSGVINPGVGDEVKESLSFLSLVSAYSANDTNMFQVCTACANQLLQEPSQFKKLVSLSALRIRCEAIDDVLSDQGSSYTIVDRSLTSDKSQDTLLTCFGVKFEKGRVIGFQSEVDFNSDVLSVGGDSTVYGLRHNNLKFVPEVLIRVISSRSLEIATRNHVAGVLVELMEAKGSFPNEVGSTLAAALDSLSSNETAALNVLVEDICLIPEGRQSSEELELSKKLALFVSYLVGVPGSSDGCKSILKDMLNKFDQWANSAPKHSIKLICLLASRFGSLNDVGKTIVSLLQKTTEHSELSGYVDCVKDFFAFVVSLDEMIKPAAPGVSSPFRGSGKMKQMVNKVGTSILRSMGVEVGEARTCSFVETGEGFTEQHWYNCYTCGLLWDKGCCSLCARVCHQGHDVGYSRKSSFFCDCGAEVATAVEENRTACKCLVPVKDETLKAVFAKADIANGGASKDESKEGSVMSHDIFIEFLVATFKSSCKESLESLIKSAKDSNWADSIISLLGSFYSDGQNSEVKDYKELLLGSSSSSTNANSSLIDIESRSGLPVKLKTQSKTSMVPLRAAKSNTVQPKVFSGSSSSQIRKGRADRSAQMIVSDNRGRLFIAESTSVLFCLAPVNVRHIQRSAISSHLTRSKLNILGSDKVKFVINGMALSPENNRHLLIWGASKAAVAIVSKGLDSFERVIELKMQSEPAECDSDSEYLLKCDWVSHSELMVVVVCGTVVHVFDLRREKDNSCDATTHYALAYEDVLIRSATLLERLPRIGSGIEYDDAIIETKLALLLDTGRLYFIDIIVDEDGNLEDQGENYIEIGAGVSFPTAGIRRYQGAEPAAKGSTSTTLGEGAHLSYLRHSNLLLYQCMSSCVVALILDDDGTIISNFEILPNMIPAADLGGSYAVVGPYHHFEELGIVERGDESFYRFSCIGKSTRTSTSSQPVLILVEFNKTDIFVRELDWPTVTGLGIMSSYSYVGSCAYSCPHLVGGPSASDGYVDDGTTIKERACLTLLTSSGSILTFGEDYATAASSSLTRSQWSSSIQRSPDIHIFESLINVSEIDQLVLGGDCVGKNHKTAKSKLSLNSTEYLACPSREGCTLTAELQPKVGQKEIEDLAIVAIRVLVGTMPDLIPSEVAIVGSGRSIKLKRNVKRWYDFPLTDEEILMAVRNGFVSIWISSCHDGSSSVIDCVEVYARTRAELSFLTAAGLPGSKADELLCKKSVQFLATKSFRRELVPCFQSLTSLVKIVSGSDDAMNSTSPNLDQATSIVTNVLELTALNQSCDERKEALTLLSEAERDVTKRTNVEDESTVRGLLLQLQNLEKFFRAEYENEDEIKPQQDVIIERGMSMLLLIMNSTMKIVQRRGHNYRKIISRLIEEKSCESSIALISKSIIDFVQTLESTHGAQPNLSSSVALNSKLILMEMACSNSDDFAQFKIIEEYFSLDSEVVKSCCAAMRSTITGGDNNGTPEVIAPPSPEKEFTSEGYVTYQCDACTTFPITGTRYTLGGEMDIDLCKQCYDKGIAYARTHDLNEAVEIDGRTLSIRGEDGDNEDMTCAKVWQMGVRVIETSTLEQAEEAKRAGFLNNMASQKTNITSSQNTDVTTSSKQGEEIDVVSTEGFASSVFSHILLFLSNTLANQSEPPSMYVLQLAVDLVLNAKTDELKASRGKEMVGALTKHLKSLIEGCSSDAELPRDTCTKIVMTLRSLTSLVLARRDIMNRKFSLETKGKSNSRQKDKTDPRFVCDVHGVPAVRRRCSHGVHKDRRFYVCGLERKHRCAYFKWSDDTTQSSTQNNDGLPLSLPVVQELQNVFAECKLESTFCGLISAQYHNQGDNVVNDSQSNQIDPFPSLTAEEDRVRDRADGVFLVSEKLGRALLASRSEDDFLDVASGTTESLLCESMDLFSYIAPKRKSSDSLVWSKGWFSILCEIISGDSGTTLRALAKKMLQRLCGFRNDIYHKVRDHYVFGFQYSKLLLQSCEFLDAALLVREQARQCGRNWRGDEVTFQSLPASGLFGTEDLISEDCMKREESISIVLDELLSQARRGENWKNFCGGLPEVNNLKRGSADVSDLMLDMLQEIFSRPPIVSLMWLGSCLGGSNQVKVFSLVDVALDKAGSKSVSISSNDKEELTLYIGGDSNRSTPEQSLTRCMTIDDVNAFICQFVLSGRSDKLRSITSAIGIKLALQFNSSDRNRLFKSLMDSGMRKIGSMGQDSINFTDVLKLFIEGFGLDLDLHHAASLFSQAFKQQMTSLNCYCEKKCSPNSDESDISKLDFDLSDCEHCHKEQLWTRLTSQDKRSSDGASDMKFLSQQMRPYQRGRLEASTASTCFSEFSSYYQLKFRVALSQVHINISDPRGRLVKTISVYYTPRQVSSGPSSDEENVNILKSDSYSRFWQKCGTINLSKGATEASLELKHPVIAANLKITFEDFYERNNSVRSSSDGPVLYCPRCTRQVTNAHGVCGNCGEVAFQCRKCRHINYDRLDAFLCVECGYCTSGGFHFELTAGIAVSAVAIVDEEQFQTSMALLRVANKRKADTTKKLTALLQKHRHVDDDDDLNELSLYGPHLKRALTGSLPKSFVDDKPEVSTSSKPIRSSSSTSRSRLLSLARSLRQDGDSLGGSRGEFLRQALLGSSGPGGGDDYMDDALLNALGGGSGSSSDPLSRLVANIRSGDGEDTAEKTEKKAKLSPAEECRRLYMQKREAERESWELNRRIDSWNRLNSDTLAAKMCNHGGTYMTTDCSVCCSKVAYKNLSLLHAVFQTNISQSEQSVSSELVKLLLQESADLDPALKDLKRQVLITIASKSESASGLVLNELQSRLCAIQDRTSAQILGELVQMDFKGVDKFIELAVSVLEG